MDRSSISRACCQMEQLDYLLTEALNKSADGNLGEVQIILTIAITILDDLQNGIMKAKG